MRSSRELAWTAVDRAADVAVATVGHAAGATVAPGTAVTKLRSRATSPAVVALVAGLALAYLLGRHGRSRTGEG